MAAVQGIRCVDIGVGNLDAAARFYGGIWGLREVERNAHACYFRGTGPYHHVLGLHERTTPALLRVVFDARDRAAVDDLYAAVDAAKAGPVEEPHASIRPGGGYGFGFRDAEGRNLAVVCAVADHADAAPAPDRPHKITHVNLNSAIPARAAEFFIATLGFKLADETDIFFFLRCNSDHHSLVIHKDKVATLNHVAFEMPDLDSVMRGGGRLKDHGYPIEWGPGRHGAGNNAFCYFAGPDEFPIEYTAEVQQVDDSYVARGPDHWRFPPGRADQWGITAPRTPRLIRIQRLFGFAGDYHLDG
jgi:catechol 2,3-dioxygenase